MLSSNSTSLVGDACNPEATNLIKSSYKNIDFRIVMKHPDEWTDHIQNVINDI